MSLRSTPFFADAPALPTTHVADTVTTPPPESLEIISHPHPVLRLPAQPICRVDSDLRAVADRMLDLMYEAQGVGLAANQVNIPLRMFVMNPSGVRGEGEEWVLINPELQLPKGSEASQEGCLSLPGIHGDVKRPKQIRLSAYDIDGQAIEKTLDGFVARVVQHENDHLDGVLFLDRMNEENRFELDDRVEELEIDFRSKQRSGQIRADDELVQAVQCWTDRYA